MNNHCYSSKYLLQVEATAERNHSHHIAVQHCLYFGWYCTFHFYRRKVTSRYSTAYSIKQPSSSSWRAISVTLSIHASRQRSKRKPVTQRKAVYPLSYGVPVRERYGSTLLPATREQHDQNCTQSH